MIHLRFLRVSLISALSILALPASALATTQVRFLHAVPGVGEATLSVDGQPAGSASFAEASEAVPVPSGQVELELRAPGGVTLTSTERLANGASYTVVGLVKGGGAELRVYRNGDAKPGLARLRMIHAAAELGDANIEVDGQVVAEGAGYTDATRYWGLPPSRPEVAVRDPDSGRPALEAQTVPLVAGTATSAFVVGSGGEPVQVVLVSDATTAPTAAPQTGLGGLAHNGDGSEGPNWLLAAVVALAVGGASALLRRRSMR